MSVSCKLFGSGKRTIPWVNGGVAQHFFRPKINTLPRLPCYGFHPMTPGSAYHIMQPNLGIILRNVKQWYSFLHYQQSELV